MRSSEKVKGSLYSPLLINDLETKRFCNRLLHDGISNISRRAKTDCDGHVNKTQIRWRLVVGPLK